MKKNRSKTLKEKVMVLRPRLPAPLRYVGLCVAAVAVAACAVAQEEAPDAAAVIADDALEDESALQPEETWDAEEALGTEGSLTLEEYYAGRETAAETGVEPSAFKDLVRMSIALVVVLGGFFFVVYLVKKFGGKSTFLLDQRFGKIIGRMQLAPKTSLYWVRLPDRILVVGTTPNAISCITEITDPKVLTEFGVAPGETEPTSAAFGKYLDRFHKRFERRKPVEERLGVAEHLEDLRSELEKIKEFSEGIDGEERG